MAIQYIPKGGKVPYDRMSPDPYKPDPYGNFVTSVATTKAPVVVTSGTKKADVVPTQAPVATTEEADVVPTPTRVVTTDIPRHEYEKLALRVAVLEAQIIERRAKKAKQVSQWRQKKKDRSPAVEEKPAVEERDPWDD